MSDLSSLGPGDLIFVGAEASIQFRARPIVAKVIRPLTEWPSSWDGWVWLRVYERSGNGLATASRDIYVRPDGVVRLPTARNPDAASGATASASPNAAGPPAPARRYGNERPPQSRRRGAQTSEPDAPTPARR